MSKTAKILIITAGTLIIAGSLLYIYSQDARRKKAYNTPVPPDYALRIIDSIKAAK